MASEDQKMTALPNPFQRFELRRSTRPQTSKPATTAAAATRQPAKRASPLQSTAVPATAASTDPAVSAPFTPASSSKRRRSAEKTEPTEAPVGPQAPITKAADTQEQELSAQDDSGPVDVPATGSQDDSGSPAQAQRPAKRSPSTAARKKKKAEVDRSGAVGMREKLGEPVQPLRMIIVGHNPSETTWRLGHAYAHPSNHMWRLLIRTGIAPEGIRGAEDDDKMPSLAGVGFSDVGTGHPGTESAAFKSDVFLNWSQNFYQRMRNHIAAASEAIGCTCGQCGAPAMIAFAGKRQFLELLNIGKKGKQKVKSVDLGLWDPSSQPPNTLPPDWPFPPSTEVWVCTSTSGAAVLTNEQREAPYRAVSQRLAQVAWPRTDVPRCRVETE